MLYAPYISLLRYQTRKVDGLGQGNRLIGHTLSGKLGRTHDNKRGSDLRLWCTVPQFLHWSRFLAIRPATTTYPLRSLQ